MFKSAVYNRKYYEMHNCYYRNFAVGRVIVTSSDFYFYQPDFAHSNSTNKKILFLLSSLHKLLSTLRKLAKDFLSKADLLIISFLSNQVSHFLCLKRSWVSMKIWNSFIHSCKKNTECPCAW